MNEEDTGDEIALTRRRPRLEERRTARVAAAARRRALARAESVAVHPRPRRPRRRQPPAQAAAPRRGQADASTSTASPCSTWATRPGRTIPTGSTSCGPPSCPSFEDEFGEDGHYFAGVRQSRLGVKGYIPTDAGELKTIFEFELFGTGVDAGQTTFRLRHA